MTVEPAFTALLSLAVPLALMLQATATDTLQYNMSQDAEIGAVVSDPGVRQGGLVRGRIGGLAALALDGRPLPIAPDGGFLVGFGRDAPEAAMLTGKLSNGAAFSRALRVARVSWPLRNLPTLPKGTPRTPEEIARRAAEVARVDAARAVSHPVNGWRQRFAWPVVGRISGVFGSQTIYAGEPGSYHTGVDIARSVGTPVLAPADGIVVLASPPQFSVEGNLLIIDHGMSLSSAFLHLSRIDVPVGARVRRGQVLGAIGATGRATGPHLHWGMVWRGVRVDPQRIAGAMTTAAAL